MSPPSPLKETRLFINGDLVPSLSKETFRLRNPATQEVVADVFAAGKEDVDRAVDSAKKAFPAWSEADGSKHFCNGLRTTLITHAISGDTTGMHQPFGGLHRPPCFRICVSRGDIHGKADLYLSRRLPRVCSIQM